MPDFTNVRVLSKQEFEKPAATGTRKRINAEEVEPYIELLNQLNEDNPGIEFYLQPDDDRKQISKLLQKAAKQENKPVRIFRPSTKDAKRANIFRFRLQGEEEQQKLKERGAKMAEGRQAKANGTKPKE